MLNTEKLLYILPDLTYLAELLPGKKENSFTIQSFKQINGNFINENEFISANIQKLFTKIDKEEYSLILPDFLFTNTIVSVDNESEAGALSHVKEKLLPSLDLTDDSHEIQINVLTSFKGKSKVQISAIEKEILAPIRVAAEKSKTIIKSVSPLSWAIKTIVSLEPSIVVLQIGGNLYSSQHYIGVDQTNNFPVDELSSIVETIKTLKGAEPSIQTIYLASSSLIEEKLKDELGGTIPIQQLATYKEEDSKMPSYVKYIIESCMKTLSISSFPVPKFKLGKATKLEVSKVDSEKELPLPEKNSEEISEDDEIETKSEVESESKSTALAELPEPSKVPGGVVMAKVEDTIIMPEDKKDETAIEIKAAETPETPTAETKNSVTVREITQDGKESIITNEPDSESEKSVAVDTNTPETKTSEALEIPSAEVKVSPTLEEPIAQDSTVTKKEEPSKIDKIVTEENDPSQVNLSQFAGTETKSELESEKLPKSETTDTMTEDTKKDETKDLTNGSKKVIKNSSGVNNMLKMVFITLAVFFITIAIGIGVGLGLLKMSDKNPKEEVASVVVSETEATPEPTATPEPEVEIVKADLSIFIVNATTKAGYAGKIKALLIDGEIADVTAGNSEGNYDEGTDYLLMLKENTQLQKLLEEASGLEFEYSSEIKIEDPDGDYDAVIVLAK